MSTKRFYSFFNLGTLLFPFTIGLVRSFPFALQAPMATRIIYGYVGIILCSLLANIFIYRQTKTRVSKLAVGMTAFYSLGSLAILFLQLFS